MKFDPFQAVEIRPSVLSLLGSLLMYCLLLFGFILLFNAGMSDPTNFYAWVKIIFMPVPALIMTILVFSTLKLILSESEPVLYIGPRGFGDRRVFDEVISWNKIAKLEAIDIKFPGFRRTKLLVIIAEERGYIFPKQLSLLKRFLNMREAAMLIYPVGGLAIPFDQLKETIDSYFHYWTNNDLTIVRGEGKSLFDLHKRHTKAVAGSTWEAR